MDQFIFPTRQMGHNSAVVNHHHHQVSDISTIYTPQNNDELGHPNRTGTIWTASAHIITAVIGSGVLSLAWAIAQLGWIAGPVVMLLFSFVSYCTASLLSDSYCSDVDPDPRRRNHTYTNVVRSTLGEAKAKACGSVQYLNLFGTAVGYTITASISMLAIGNRPSGCFRDSGGTNHNCNMSSNPYMIVFGITEMLLSLIIPDLHRLWWLSIVSALTSFTYSFNIIGLGISHIAGTGVIMGSLTGIIIGNVTEAQKKWKCFQALGALAFASSSFSLILIEIQDTIRSPPAESKTMKRATLLSIGVTTFMYMLCGFTGYAAFGDMAPVNILTGFSLLYKYPQWLLNIANAAIVIHLVGAYQVCCQPIFAFVEKFASQRWPDSYFITKQFRIPIPRFGVYKLNLFRTVWRSAFVVTTTVVSMVMPFFKDLMETLCAVGFARLTVHYPIEMYIANRNIPKWSTKWICLQLINVMCLGISVMAAAGSIVAVVGDLKVYRPFNMTN